MTRCLLQRSGTGKITYHKGGHYDGDWENDVINGNGIMEYMDGSKYEGSWKNSQVGICSFSFLIMSLSACPVLVGLNNIWVSCVAYSISRLAETRDRALRFFLG